MHSVFYPMSILLTLIGALLIDHFVGEATRFHPLVYFGNFVTFIEKKYNKGADKSRLIKGAIAWCFLVLPVPLFFYWLITFLPFYLIFIINVYVVYWAVALNSLDQHGMQIYDALKANDLAQAQHYCGYIVSRETSELDEKAICRATTESMLENGHDGVTATLIYFVIGGAPLVIAHRLSNTLDAMWGYRTERFNYFGKISARMDDLFSFLSGKITVLLFTCIGLFNRTALASLRNAHCQSQHYKSHNGGWVMAAGATCINVCLGGTARYAGKIIESPQLGEGESVQSKHIKASLILVKQAVFLWLLFILSWLIIV